MYRCVISQEKPCTQWFTQIWLCKMIFCCVTASSRCDITVNRVLKWLIADVISIIWMFHFGQNHLESHSAHFSSRPSFLPQCRSLHIHSPFSVSFSKHALILIYFVPKPWASRTFFLVRPTLLHPSRRILQDPDVSGLCRRGCWGWRESRNLPQVKRGLTTLRYRWLNTLSSLLAPAHRACWLN